MKSFRIKECCTLHSAQFTMENLKIFSFQVVVESRDCLTRVFKNKKKILKKVPTSSFYLSLLVHFLYGNFPVITISFSTLISLTAKKNYFLSCNVRNYKKKKKVDFVHIKNLFLFMVKISTCCFFHIHDYYLNTKKTVFFRKNLKT
jgi:hypothetical protein